MYWKRLWQESHSETNTPTLLTVRMDTNCVKFGLSPFFQFSILTTWRLLTGWHQAPHRHHYSPNQPYILSHIILLPVGTKAMYKEMLKRTQQRMWFNPKSQTYILATAAHFLKPQSLL